MGGGGSNKEIRQKQKEIKNKERNSYARFILKHFVRTIPLLIL